MLVSRPEITEGYSEGLSESSLSKPAGSRALSAYKPDTKSAHIGNLSCDGTSFPLIKFLLVSLIICLFTHC